MRKILLFVIAAILVITLYACSLFNPPATEGATSLAGDLPALSLAVQGQSGTYNAVGQNIPYTYTVTNLGNPQLAGPVTIVDDKMAATCPAVNTVGNNDDNLDTLESL